MVRKVLLGLAVLVLAVMLVAGAFAGGVVVGRVTDPEGYPAAASPEPGSTTPEDLAPTPVGGEALPSSPEVGEATQGPGGGSLPAAQAFDYEILRTVLELLDEQFYGDIPDGKTLAYGAIRGMLLTLDDPYTSFIDPQISAVLNEDAEGEFEGIGAMVTMRDDGYLEIASLMAGQPAEAAGILPGDVVLSVNGTSIVGLGLYEAISYIRGPAGTTADLEIARQGEAESLFISVVRARIEIQNVEARMLDGNIGYISLAEFSANAAESLEVALSDLLQNEPAGLVFDLRGNPGGWLTQAILVADLFLDRGVVAIERDSDGNEQRFPSGNGQIGESIPLVVLVNRGSASASEIVAGAIQDRDRGVLVGEQTLGKGSVQRPNDLDDGSQLRVTIARWFTPNEQELHGAGLTPDIEVDIPEDASPESDPQLERAVQYLLTGE